MTTKQYWRAGLALGADILAYVSVFNSLFGTWFNNLSEDIHEIVAIIRWVIIVVLSLVFFYYVLVWFLRKKLKAAGTNGIECDFNYYYYYKLLNRNKSILIHMHKYIYHSAYNITKEIEKNGYKKKDDVKKSINVLLGNFREALYHSFNIDVSVEVKIVKKRDEEKLLQTYLFVPGSKEQEMEERNLKKTYILNELDSDDVTDYVKKSKKFAKDKGSGDVLTNSAFDYVLSTTKTFWMSNDLAIDTANGNFFTSSENLNNHYRSMAVFAIIPPGRDGEENLPIDGILIFDSKDIGIFSEIECKFMMGYMAHCLYDIFKNIE